MKSIISNYTAINLIIYTFRIKLLKVLVQARKLKETEAHETEMVITTTCPLLNSPKNTGPDGFHVFHQTHRPGNLSLSYCLRKYKK